MGWGLGRPARRSRWLCACLDARAACALGDGAAEWGGRMHARAWPVLVPAMACIVHGQRYRCVLCGVLAVACGSITVCTHDYMCGVPVRVSRAEHTVLPVRT